MYLESIAFWVEELYSQLSFEIVIRESHTTDGINNQSISQPVAPNSSVRHQPAILFVLFLHILQLVLPALAE